MKKLITEFHANKGISGAYPHCKSCVSLTNLAWRNANPGRRNEGMKRWSDANQAHRRNYNLEKNYGITSEEYNRLLEAQAGVCAICKQPPNEAQKRAMYLSVDHCHTTGRIRGLLCISCNSAIGLLKESAELMAKALKYLGKGDCDLN